MFFKPYGCVCARRDDTYPTVMDYFAELHNENLSPVGRLDRETEGLLFITDDGKWNQKLTHPEYHIEKTYEFIALGFLDEGKLQKLESGVTLIGSDTLTAPAKVTVTGTSVLSEVLPTLHPELQQKTVHNRPEHPVVFGEITITEGKKHQVRRMLKAVGCCIIYLKRISVGSVLLDVSLKKGEWKEIFPPLPL
ncbi:MAG: pseudouridine synthase [Lachnospiraceae bacterium]|nr:pseudouridine synthase [Lachnospiraceae bacterium]